MEVFYARELPTLLDLMILIIVTEKRYFLFFFSILSRNRKGHPTIDAPP